MPTLGQMLQKNNKFSFSTYWGIRSYSDILYYSINIMKKQSQTLKYLVIGDSGVGKTCVLMRYCEDTFQSDLLSTVGVDFKIKRLCLDGKDVCLNIWDTAGQERFKNITKSFYKNANGIVVTYSIDNPNSFNHVQNWIQQIRQNGGDDVAVILVANKADMQERRLVSKKMGEDLAFKHKMKFFEVSAKENRNIKEVFQTLTLQIIKKNPNKSNLNPVGTILHESNQHKKKKKNDCCK